MPIQHSLPAIKTRSQARTQPVLTPTPRVFLDGTPEVSQLRAQLDKGPHFEGAAQSRKEGRGLTRSSPGENGEEEEENCVEEEESDDTESVPASVGESQGIGGPTLAHSDQNVSHHFEASLLAIMQKMTQIMANLQAASSSESSRPPDFNMPSINAPACFDLTQPFKVRSFIQSCQLIFHNDLENFSQERKKVLYATPFPIGSAGKWIELYLSNINNQDPRYLLNSWKLF
ncbi:hypothetical protein O181_012957 [Austropuccinia psidii MF-1]|uniref:DUF4939 domain-containing protein n=1 Tax=Austropuccinia psidii MF-1 TaxID=1389203 RepID=A0A9Q3BXC7_9BASI|nr:hypothetical protein [Austropuccinia psidii MF-1]